MKRLAGISAFKTAPAPLPEVLMQRYLSNKTSVPGRQKNGAWSMAKPSEQDKAMSIDYFGKYFTSEGFDLPNLINDDFMAPIRLLYQNRHYVSATKLLLTFIDSVGYVEYGDSEKNPFTKWLTAYAILTEVGVSPDELWEHRNSLLHMSNLDSRKVLAGTVKRLMCYVGVLPPGIPTETTEAKYYSLQHLIFSIANGCQRWFESYNEDRDKIELFVKRYDLIASDNRMLWIDLSKST